MVYEGYQIFNIFFTFQKRQLSDQGYKSSGQREDVSDTGGR